MSEGTSERPTANRSKNLAKGSSDVNMFGVAPKLINMHHGVSSLSLGAQGSRGLRFAGPRLPSSRDPCGASPRLARVTAGGRDATPSLVHPAPSRSRIGPPAGHGPAAPGHSKFRLQPGTRPSRAESQVIQFDPVGSGADP
jgi:hypothetical protein